MGPEHQNQLVREVQLGPEHQNQSGQEVQSGQGHQNQSVQEVQLDQGHQNQSVREVQLDQGHRNQLVLVLLGIQEVLDIPLVQPVRPVQYYLSIQLVQSDHKQLGIYNNKH